MDKPNKYYQNAALSWITRAEDDIAWTKNNIESGFYSQACFTAQQIAEKALKAFLRSRRKEINRDFKIHQLLGLLRQCEKFDKDFRNLEENCRILNEYYAPTRYPEMLGLQFRGYGKNQAEEAFQLAKEIFEFVRERLKD